MAVRKILCPIDFSTGATQALRSAARIAKELEAELVLAHAWYIPPIAFAGGLAPVPYGLDDLATDTKRLLAEVGDQALAMGAPSVSTRILHGLPWEQIVGLLASEQFDLCVIGARGTSVITRVLIGSMTEQVVRRAPCPVLVIRPTNEPVPYRHALVPLDLAQSVDEALELAATLVHAPDGLIELMFVIDMPGGGQSGTVLSKRAIDLHTHATDRLAALTQALQARTTARVQTRIVVGRPGAEILHYLERTAEIDLVVLGTHGRTGLQRFLLGSVAEKIVRHASCPAVVAHSRS